MTTYTIRIQNSITINAENDEQAIKLANEAIENGIEFVPEIVEKLDENGNIVATY